MFGRVIGSNRWWAGGFGVGRTVDDEFVLERVWRGVGGEESWSGEGEGRRRECWEVSVGVTVAEESEPCGGHG